MTKTKKRPSATVTMFVAVEQSIAFEVFTEEIDSWWRHGTRYRVGTRGDSTMKLEPGVGGRLVEIVGDKILAFGIVVAWEPPRRIELAWKFPNAMAADETTEVEITFEAVDEGTQVTLQHRGLHELPADHPALHGKDAAGISRMFGGYWSELAQALREIAVTRAKSKSS